MGPFSTVQRRPDLRTAFLLAVFFFFFYLLFYDGHFGGIDEVHVYETTRSIVEKRDLSVPAILNSRQGRGGLYYSKYPVGQSALAVPFYLAGKLARRVLPARLSQALAGILLQEGALQWGGTVEIFFTGLYAPFAGAVLTALFFLFQRSLGVSLRNALLASVLLGVSTYTAAMSIYFLRHTTTAAALLGSLHCLFQWRQTRSPVRGLAAGLLLAAGLQIREDAMLALPAIGVFAAWTAFEGRHDQKLRFARSAAAFAVPVAASTALLIYVHHFKWGWRLMSDNVDLFSGSLLTSLWGFILSPGCSVFVYSPLLLAAVPPWRRFLLSHRPLGVTTLLICFSYLAFYSMFIDWHGLWSAPGPRYLLIAVPLTLLPFGLWLDTGLSRKVRIWLAALAFAGGAIQLILMSVNFAYTYNRLALPELDPPYATVFLPEHSPIAVMGSLLLQGELIDSWVLNLWRGGLGVPAHPGWALAALAAILLCLGATGRRLQRRYCMGSRE